VATVAAIMDALASQIDNEIGSQGTADPLIADLQVDGRMVFNPTPPAIDIYPADPFQDALAFGKGNNELFLTVRARVTTADHEAGQDLLLSLMDPEALTSVAQAVLADRTLGNTVERVNVSAGPTAYGVFPVLPGQTGEALLGCTWTVRVIP
jgi:hypothetical protein